MTAPPVASAPAAAPAAASVAPAIPEAELQAAIATLRHQLEDGDPDAGEVMADLLGKLQGSALARKLQPVAAALEGFDFDVALDRLKEAGFA